MRSEDIARDLVFSRGDMRTGTLQFIVKRILESKRVYLVGDGIAPEEAAQYGVAATVRALDEALGARRRRGAGKGGARGGGGGMGDLKVEMGKKWMKKR